ncbi:MAG TPA: type II secretion system F family protein [Pseudonocardiaceae bacterium]|jgi:Flp pilus assembly protein TadB|nr:type II secretion system F family protein [Pseudonocardiaceae bacterium]
MNPPAIAALLLAAAISIGPGKAAIAARIAALHAQPTPPGRRRRGWQRSRSPTQGRRLLPLAVAAATACLPALLSGPAAGLLLGPLLGGAVFLGSGWLIRRRPGTGRRSAETDALQLASGWDLLAACLRGGLPVPTAVQSVAVAMPGDAGPALRSTAELLSLGADPAEAWLPALRHPLTARLAKGARRSARSGAALAGLAEALAVEVRSGAHDLAEASAQRAAVAVTGPLGLCFLPAFLCLGVVPVVIGLAARLIASW